MPDEKEMLRNLSAVEEAEQRAYVRGQETTLVKSRLDEHDRRLAAINGSIDKAARKSGELADRVDKLSSLIERNAAIVSARAEDAKQAAEAQVSTRTFVLGLVGAVTAIGALLAGTGHA